MGKRQKNAPISPPSPHFPPLSCIKPTFRTTKRSIKNRRQETGDRRQETIYSGQEE
ncbi:MAG: hypothetical protein AB4080_16030 [Trichodesmium sp.]